MSRERFRKTLFFFLIGCVAVALFIGSYWMGRRFLLLRSGVLIREHIPLSAPQQKLPNVSTLEGEAPKEVPLKPVALTETSQSPKTSEPPKTLEPPKEAHPEFPKKLPEEKESSGVTQKYRVQAGVFSDRSRAESLVAQLQEKKFEAFVKELPDGKFLVQCGVFGEKKWADQLVEELRDAHFEAEVIGF